MGRKFPTKAHRGAAYFALACLLGASLLFVRLRRPPEIIIGFTEHEHLEDTTASGLGETIEGKPDTAGRLTTEGDSNPSETPKKNIAVHVAGSVANPGLYELSEGSRVNDAILAAGGMSRTADADAVNIALPIRDGQQVFVPFKKEISHEQQAAAISKQASAVVSQPLASVMPPNGRMDVTQSEPAEVLLSMGSDQPASKVDINVAGQAELEGLPGIGPSLAMRIMEYRKANGPFSGTEQLMDVSGIGPAKYEAMKDLVVVK